MKLNLTKTEVMATVMPVEIETCTFDKDGKPLKLFVGHYVEDWLTLHAEVEAQTKLIEQLDKALLKVEHPCLDTNQNIAECAICGTQTNRHYDYCEVGLVLSEIKRWRTGKAIESMPHTCENCMWWDKDKDKDWGDCTNETACLSGVIGRTPKDFGCIKWEQK
jgi:hypothetical protein